jgi:hypothetical protein
MTAVSVSLDRGKVRRWILSFERPGAGTKPEQVETRYPGCKRVLDTIAERYGPPGNFSTRIEEGMQHRLRTWSDSTGALRLDCGKLLKRNPIFAIDIEITPPAKSGRLRAPTGAAAIQAELAPPGHPASYLPRYFAITSSRPLRVPLRNS